MLLPLRKYREEDADILCANSTDADVQTVDWKKFAKFNGEAGPAYTYEEDDIPVFALGMRLLVKSDGKTVGWPWCILTKEALKKKLSVFATLKRILHVIMKNCELKEAVCESRKGFVESQRLLEHLGFTRMDYEDDKYYYYELGA